MAADDVGRRVVNIYGPGGIGKTALAITYARTVAGDFPDGQLFASLEAYGPSAATPVSLNDVLKDFVFALQAQGVAVPGGTAELIERYRQLTGQRRLLIVIDDVPDDFPLATLMPSDEGCLVLTTSRTRLADPVVGRQLELGPLSADASTELLARITNSTDPVILRPLAEACCRQPLALKLAGNALAHRPAPEFAAATQRAIVVAGAGDGGEPLAAAYGFLTDDERTAFRSISAIDQETFSPSALAAAADVEERAARNLADRLTEAMLLDRRDPEPYAESCYVAQDVVRAYARLRAQAEDSSRVRTERLARVASARARRRAGISAPELRRHVFALEMQGSLARALEAARGALTIAQERGDAEAELAARVVIAELSAELGNVNEAKAMAIRASTAADLATRARACRCLGHARRRLFQYDLARRDLGEAVTLAERCGDRAELARSLSELAIAEMLATSDLGVAVGYSTRAEAICRGSTDQAGQSELGRTLTASGRVLFHADRLSEAGQVLADAVDACTQLGQRLRLAYALYWSASVALSAKKLAEARSSITVAIDMFAAMQHYYGLARCRKVFGDIELVDGDAPLANDYLQQAVDTFYSCGDPAVEAETLTALAETSQVLGRWEEAERFEADASAVRELLRRGAEPRGAQARAVHARDAQAEESTRSRAPGDRQPKATGERRSRGKAR